MVRKKKTGLMYAAQVASATGGIPVLLYLTTNPGAQQMTSLR
jgi:hypothetical protein